MGQTPVSDHPLLIIRGGYGVHFEVLRGVTVLCRLVSNRRLADVDSFSTIQNDSCYRTKV